MLRPTCARGGICGTKPQVLLGPVLNIRKKKIGGRVQKHTEILTGKATLLLGRTDERTVWRRNKEHKE